MKARIPWGDGAAGTWGAVLAGFGAETCTFQVLHCPSSLFLMTTAMGMVPWDEPQLKGTVLGRGSHLQAALRA